MGRGDGDGHDRDEAHRGMMALDLARAHIAAMHLVDPDEIASIEAVVLDAAQLVAELAGPGAWEVFDAREFAARISFLPELEQAASFLQLIGFFGWMTLMGLMDPSDGANIADDIVDAAPPAPALAELRDALLSQLGPPLH